MTDGIADSEFVQTWAGSWLRTLLCFSGTSLGGLWVFMFVFKQPFQWNSFLGIMIVPLIIAITAHVLRRKGTKKETTLRTESGNGQV